MIQISGPCTVFNRALNTFLNEPMQQANSGWIVEQWYRTHTGAWSTRLAVYADSAIADVVGPKIKTDPAYRETEEQCKT